MSTTATASGKLANGTQSNGHKKRPSGAAKNGNKFVERSGQAAKTFVGRQVGVALKAAGARLHQTADSLGKIGGDLHEPGNDALLGDLSRTLAGYVERFSSYLDEADSNSLFNDLERYGRALSRRFRRRGLRDRLRPLAFGQSGERRAPAGGRVNE